VNRPELTPRQIVEALDRHVVGQREAKRAVAIAIRNRFRRLRLEGPLRDEVIPKNILMIGPTGVGKTEIARRLALLLSAPFIKVEATKYTEVGYVGRDVESMIRDLLEVGINLVRSERLAAVSEQAEARAEDRLLDLLLPGHGADPRVDVVRPATPAAEAESRARTREKLRERLVQGTLDSETVEVTVEERAVPLVEIPGLEQAGIGPDLQGFFERLAPPRMRTRRVSVGEARRILAREEGEKLLDRERINREAIERVEGSGIVFIDELDKVAFRGAGHGPDVSREGVQRDLLPIVEGSTVTTRHGPVRTAHILFIAAGAFHMSKPADLIPELQGRFPIRVTLDDLSEADFVRILTEPENALVRQYAALLRADDLEVDFEREAIQEIARIAALQNKRSQNIGARRLHTVMERLLEPESFSAPERRGERLTVTAALVRQRLEPVIKDDDLARYIL
jgi:ATP-dependent HslUV protease ATP-binding subunit HslU